MPDSESKPPAKSPEPTRKRRRSPGLAVLLIGLLLLLWQREEITFRFNLMAILRSEVPDQSWMREMGGRDERAMRMVRELWSTGRLPHRRAVVEYLRSQITRRPQLIQQSAPMLMEAALDPDHSLRELLISGLKMAKISE